MLQWEASGTQHIPLQKEPGLWGQTMKLSSANLIWLHGSVLTAASY
jgi:hypothetical protein